MEFKTSDFFGESGFLSTVFDGYRPRQGQIDFCNFWDQRIDKPAVTIIEGPCGTGKSFGYLIRSLAQVIGARAHFDGEMDEAPKLFITTAGKSLTGQICNKDLPFLQKLFADKCSKYFTFAEMKGAANFLCMNRWDSTLYERNDKDEIVPTDEHRKMSQYKGFAKFQAWTKRTETGEYSEIDFEYDWRLQAESSADSQTCVDCTEADGCHFRVMKNKCKNAAVIAVNYHLFCINSIADWRVFNIPSNSVIVCDEAHELPDIALDIFGETLSQKTIMGLRMKVKDQDLIRKIQRASYEYGSMLERVKNDVNAYREYLRDSNGIDLDFLLGLAGEVEAYHAKRLSLLDLHAQGASKKRVAIDRKRTEMRLQKFTEAVRRFDQYVFGELPDMDNVVVGINEHDDVWSAILLNLSPGSNLSKKIWQPLLNRGARFLLTSATLSIGKSFEFIKSELGVSKRFLQNVDVAELAVDSPFDFDKSVRLIIPDGLIPETRNSPYFKRWQENLSEFVQGVVDYSGGRTLVLTTTTSSTLQLGKSLKHPTGGVITKQGDKGLKALIEEFRDDETSVLIGSMSLWTGVDVPGDSLKAVVIDKLPFPSLGSPRAQAIKDRNSKTWFTRWYLPSMMLKVLQGAGRLIRHEDDKGLLVICDSRIHHKRYGSQLIRALPRKRVDFKTLDQLKAHS